MRVTLVCPIDPSPLSVREERFPRLAAALAARGLDVTLLAPTASRNRASLEGDVRVVRVRSGGGRPGRALAAHLPQEADLVHVPAPGSWAVPVLRAARRAGQPAVLDVRRAPRSVADRLLGAPGYALADAVLVPSLLQARAWPALRGVPMARWRASPDARPPRGWAGVADALLPVYAEVLGRPCPLPPAPREVRPPARLGRHAVL